MQRTLQNNLSPFAKLLLDLLIMFVVFLVVFATGLIIGAKMFGVGAMDLLRRSVALGDIGALRYVVMLQTLSLFFFPALVIAWFFGKPAEYLQMSRVPSLRTAGLIIVIFFIAQLLVNYLAVLNSGLKFPGFLAGLEERMRLAEQQTAELTRTLLSGKTWGDLAISLIVVALIPAVSEEFFFRGILQRHIIEGVRNYHIGIWLTAFIFAFVHFQFFTFLPRFVLGVLLGYIFYWQRSIWASSLAHFTNNALGVVMYFIAVRKGLPLEQLDQPHKVPFWAAALSLVAVVALMLQVKEE